MQGRGMAYGGVNHARMGGGECMGFMSGALTARVVWAVMAALGMAAPAYAQFKGYVTATWAQSYTLSNGIRVEVRSLSDHGVIGPCSAPAGVAPGFSFLGFDRPYRGFGEASAEFGVDGWVVSGRRVGQFNPWAPNPLNTVPSLGVPEMGSLALGVRSVVYDSSGRQNGSVAGPGVGGTGAAGTGAAGTGAAGTGAVSAVGGAAGAVGGSVGGSDAGVMPATAAESARMALMAGDRPGAVGLLERHLREDPEDVRAMRALGILYATAGREGEGFELVERAYFMDVALAEEPMDRGAVARGEDWRRLLVSVMRAGQRSDSAGGWLTAAVLKQAEGDRAGASRMIERATAKGLEPRVERAMREALADPKGAG